VEAPLVLAESAFAGDSKSASEASRGGICNGPIPILPGYYRVAHPFPSPGRQGRRRPRTL